LSAIARYSLLALGLYAWGATPSRAEDLERGKSGPAIFAADCAACHRSAQGLAYGMSSRDLIDLLRQHYTTGPGPAGQVANYLLSVVGNGRRPKEKPLTEPQPTAAGPASEQGKRRARGEEAVTEPAGQRPPGEIRGTEPAGQRPPGEIRGNEAAVGEPGAAAAGDRGRPGPAPKRRQQADRPAEPALPGRSKKPGPPATATRGTEPEPARPPETIQSQPSDSVAARPPEPPAARQPGASGETKPAETAPRAENAKVETAPETDQVRTAAPIEPPRPAPRQETGDQSAFSAPSP
jgi:hypothetical protein